MPAPERVVRDDVLLRSLLIEVHQARNQLRDHRGALTHVGSPEAHRTRQLRLVDALEAYAQAATRAGVPLSYRYRDELRLYRSIQEGTPRRPGPVGD